MQQIPSSFAEPRVASTIAAGAHSSRFGARRVSVLSEASNRSNGVAGRGHEVEGRARKQR